MISIRLALQFTLLLTATIVCQQTYAVACNGRPTIANIKEENGILSVTGQSGSIATTSNTGVTWNVGQGTGSELPPFWRKSFLSDGTTFQNISDGNKIISISKGIDKEFWSIADYHLVLFGSGHQLFSFRGETYLGYDYIDLDSGQIKGSSDAGFPSITIEVTPHTFCQLTYDTTTRGNVCRQPFHASNEEHRITGFFAQPNGNFYMSTNRNILYLDVATDHWSRIPPPVEWQCSP